MVLSNSTKGGKIGNVLILLAIVLAAVAAAMALVKIKPDPKDTGSFRYSLGLGKKK